MASLIDGVKKFNVPMFFIFVFSKLLVGLGIGILLASYLLPYGWPILILGIGLSIGCLGLAFKADVDDLRESPALAIVRQLVKDEIGDVIVSEPNIGSSDDFTLMTCEEVINKADIVLILVDHKEYKNLPLMELNEKVIIDTRGIIR